METTRKWKSVLAGMGMAAVLLTGCQKQKEETAITGSGLEAPLAPNERLIPDQYIVWLHDEVLEEIAPNAFRLPGSGVPDLREAVAMEATDMLATNSIAGVHIAKGDAWSAVGAGFVARMSAAQADALRKDPRVRSIVQDRIISLGNGVTINGKPGGGSSSQPAQSTPWGITRVGGGGSNTTLASKAWVIDTGVDSTHPDLNVQINEGVSFLSSGGNRFSSNDENGHGSHVSGTIGAYNNSIGVIGVCPGAKIVAVRVLDRNGSGSTSGVIKGVNHVALNGKPGDVANMSLGGSAYTLLDNAIKALADKGIYVAVAAGNDGANAANYSPARVDYTSSTTYTNPNTSATFAASVYTISAIDASNKLASFSNYGSVVDYAAPGVSIPSCYKGGGYTTMSGTSMATPHVAGIILARQGAPATNGTISGDKDSNPDPIAHM